MQWGADWAKRPEFRLKMKKKALSQLQYGKKKRYKEQWQGGETLSVAIGQSYNLVTPLQMAVLIAAVGNGGTLFRPRIVRTIKDGYGVLVKKIEPEITGGLPASKETLKIVRKGLLKAVQGQRGTAKKIRLENIEIAGKTGTAQVYSIKKK